MQVIVNKQEQQAMDEVESLLKQLDEKGVSEFRAMLQGVQLGINVKMRAAQNPA